MIELKGARNENGCKLQKNPVCHGHCFVYYGLGRFHRVHPQKQVAETPTLYERVGGINNIAILVDDVIERSYVDPVFAANPRIHAAHKRFPKAVYKYNATALACQVFGGPQVYTGRSLKEAHKH
jgi:hypothetical protein